MSEKSETKYIIIDNDYEYNDKIKVYYFTNEEDLIKALTKDFSTRLHTVGVYRVEKLTPEISVNLK